MPLHTLLRHCPARAVLALIRTRALEVPPPAVDPWPMAWPASPMHAPTVFLPLYERH